MTKDVPAAKTGTLSPLKLRPIVVDAAAVHARIGTPGVSVVDGRDAAFYDGVETGGAHGEKHRTGHIHGALSIPFTSITDDKLLLKSDAELAALFTKAGVKPGDTVIGYCHIGQQTTAMLFAARTLGLDAPRISACLDSLGSDFTPERFAACSNTAVRAGVGRSGEQRRRHRAGGWGGGVVPGVRNSRWCRAQG